MPLRQGPFFIGGDFIRSGARSWKRTSSRTSMFLKLRQLSVLTSAIIILARQSSILHVYVPLAAINCLHYAVVLVVEASEASSFRSSVPMPSISSSVAVLYARKASSNSRLLRANRTILLLALLNSFARERILSLSTLSQRIENWTWLNRNSSLFSSSVRTSACVTPVA